jgi:hypothetical protein
MSFQIELQNVRCWDPDSGFSVFAANTGMIDIAALTAQGEAATVQIGPYRVKVTIAENALDSKGTVSLLLGEQPIAMSKSSRGTVFVQLDTVERMSMDGTNQILGSARGCFDISW